MRVPFSIVRTFALREYARYEVKEKMRLFDRNFIIFDLVLEALPPSEIQIFDFSSISSNESFLLYNRTGLSLRAGIRVIRI